MNTHPRSLGTLFNPRSLALTTLTLTGALALNAHATISVSNPPTNKTVYEGQSTTFALNATSDRTIQNYWWYKNGTLVGTSARYSISNVALSHAGTYSCKASDGATIYYCNSFTLTVNQIVRITTQPSNVMVNEGATASMRVAATGTGPLAYQWYFGGKPITGATQSSISTGAASLADAGQYYCVVKNAGSTATSTTATMSVMAVPTSYSVSLSWTRPTVRADGSTLASGDISGYNIYYGTSSTGTMSRIASLSASTLNYTANSLSAGTHYFAASTIDSNGQESNLSSRISRTLQ